MKTHVLGVTKRITRKPENEYLNFILDAVAYQPHGYTKGTDIRIERLNHLASSLRIPQIHRDQFEIAVQWFGNALKEKFPNDPESVDYLVNFAGTMIRYSNKFSLCELKKISVLGLMTTRVKTVQVEKLEKDIDVMLSKFGADDNHSLAKAVDDYVSKNL